LRKFVLGEETFKDWLGAVYISLPEVNREIVGQESCGNLTMVSDLENKS
jgi:hypothetical protein